ncbi:hypothetical protein LCGC14_0235390 [marine sediment metagenome]|uniref:Uncharacterized protein n=1 Tax=marine sediment metagenome TaxID=412755 RepID=A0A0F9XD52_9ZZZZ
MANSEIPANNPIQGKGWKKIFDEDTVKRVCEQIADWDNWEHEEFFDLAWAGEKLDEKPKAVHRMVQFIMTRANDEI